MERQTLRELYKLLGQALGEQAVTKKISVTEYPLHAIGVFAQCAADPDRNRATKRLSALRAELAQVAKQIEGIEDTASEMIEVEVFQTPELTAQPRVETELDPQAAGTALGTSGIAFPNGSMPSEQLQTLFEQQKKLGEAVAALQAQLGSHLKQRDGKDDDEKMPAGTGKKEPPPGGASPDDEPDAPAKQSDSDDEETEKRSRLGDFIRERREALGKTPDEIGQSAGIKGGTIGDIERGRIARPPDEVLQGIARSLRVSFDDLVKLIPVERKSLDDADKAKVTEKRDETQKSEDGWPKDMTAESDAVDDDLYWGRDSAE